jgi:hypothetical protein
VDTACSDAVSQILDAAQAGIWEWLCTNGLDHKKQEIGSHAVRGLHCVTRFGPLTYDELYRLGGRVYGEKNCQKGTTRLVKDKYLVQTRLGRKKLFGLHPFVAQLLPCWEVLSTCFSVLSTFGASICSTFKSIDFVS